MSDIQSKLFDLLYIVIPAIIFVGLFFVLEQKRKK